MRQFGTSRKPAAEGRGEKAGADSGWAIGRSSCLERDDASNGRQKLQELLAANERMKDANGANGWWWYNLGILQAAADQKGAARESFRKALLLPDRMMSHHLARVGHGGSRVRS